jgi:hypothetical protein
MPKLLIALVIIYVLFVLCLMTIAVLSAGGN